MRAVKRLLRCIKYGVIGFLGGDAHGKYGIAGLLILFVYWLFVAFIIVGSQKAEISADITIRILLIGTGIYLLLLIISSLLYDLVRHIILKR